MPTDEAHFADVLATRGTRATPESPFIIEHREALIYMLCLAAELEHAIMCQYLYAAFSLKQTVDDGRSEAQLPSVDRWRQAIAHVAIQETLHLTLVQNLLTSIGAAPYLSRLNLPPPAGRYPPTVALTLLPFGERALRHFMFLERPEGMASLIRFWRKRWCTRFQPSSSPKSSRSSRTSRRPVTWIAPSRTVCTTLRSSTDRSGCSADLRVRRRARELRAVLRE